MTGLLNPGRPCLRGHGQMALQEGSFALVGVNKTPQNSLLALASNREEIRMNQQMFVMRVYRCTVCGALELVDQE